MLSYPSVIHYDLLWAMWFVSNIVVVAWSNISLFMYDSLRGDFFFGHAVSYITFGLCHQEALLTFKTL